MSLDDVVMGEVVKTIAANVTSAGLAGTGRLWHLIRHKTGPSAPDTPVDTAELRRRLIDCARDDPDWARQVALELAETVSTPLAAELGAAFVPPIPFCDRNTVRDELPESGVFGFAGPRGCGKTALVAQFAVDRAARFPIYRAVLDLDEFRAGDLVRFAEAKRHVLRQLGITDAVVAEPELGLQYRRALLIRRVLLVVENVLGADEVAALVADWPAALVLVTTRRLTKDLRVLIRSWREMGGLDPAGARALLALCCPESLIVDEQLAAETLLERFGRQPHAIRVLGAILSVRAGERGPVAGLLSELDSIGVSGTDGLLTAVLTGHLAQAPEVDEEAFGLLALCPAGQFTIETAAVLLSRSARWDVELLRELGLIEAIGAGRFRMSWAVRRFAGELGTPVDADAALDRLLDYYASRAVAADLAGGPRMRYYRIPAVAPWPDDEDRIRWLDSEAEVLAGLVEYAYLRGHDDEVGQLCGALEVLSRHRGRHEMCLVAYERGVESASRQGFALLLARQHGLAGRAATMLHRFDRARTELDSARVVAVQAGDPALVATTWEFLGRLAEEQAGTSSAPDWQPAIRAFNRALEIDRGVGSARRARGLHARMLANVLVKAGQVAEALSLSAEAIAHTDHGDDRNASRVFAVRAKCGVVLGDLGAARADLDRARALAAAAGADHYRLELDDLTAEIEFREGNVSQARSRWAAIAQAYANEGHPRSAEYVAKLNWVPPGS